MNNENKRVFFGFEVQALWPTDHPKGRMVDPAHRHLTIAFIGNVDWNKLEPHLINVPRPTIKVGLMGKFDRVVFLPHRRANVVAYHVEWLESFDFNNYQIKVADWLASIGLPIHLHKGDFLPHVTICRRPFSIAEWEDDFHPFPLYISNFHLYESKPGLTYQPIWTHSILPPFDHDHAYGERIEQLDLHKDHAFKLKLSPSLSMQPIEGILSCPIN